eukprot:gene40970-50692_t
MKNQLAGLMKQAQAMQDNMKKAQDALGSIEVEGQSGAGLVKVVMTCKNDVKRVSIDPSLLADDKDMLEDLVAAAFNDAVRKAEATSAEKMAGLTSGMNLPVRKAMFIISLTYLKPAEEIDALLAAHREYLREQYDNGMFLMSGRMVPRTGGIIIATADSRADIEAPAPPATPSPNSCRP